jgi:hypothetical protein
MNKSTPLAQLPNTNTNTMQNQTFVTEQQRQYISQAQNAISNSHMPQNTQLSADIINDDDVVVQDILNQINASTDNSQQQVHQSGNEPTPQQIQQMNQQIMMQQMAAQQQHQQNMMAAQQQNGNGMFIPQQSQQQAMLLAQLNSMGGGNPYENIIQNSHPTEFKDYLLLFADDLKLASLVFIVVILVHFVPLDKFLSRYFAIDKIPYHEVLLRAIMAALFIIIIKKLAKI